MQLFRSHGVTRDPTLMTKRSEGGWYYQQIDLGFNYRMTELQAALGTSQMQRIDEFISKRHILLERYNSLLCNLAITRPYQDKDSYSALHLYPIQIDMGINTKSREKIFNELRNKGIGVNVHYIPVHTQPYYQQFGFSGGDFPISEGYYSKAISLPIYHGMKFSEQDLIVDKLAIILKG